MNKETYMNKIQKLLDLKLSQKRSDLIIEARELIKTEISSAVKEILGFSKNSNKKFYDLDKSFIESGNFVQHKILHRLVSFESISWNDKDNKVDFDIDLFEKEIDLTEILSDKLDTYLYKEFTSKSWNDFFYSFKSKESFEDFMDFANSILMDLPPYEFKLFLNLENLKLETKPIPTKTIYLRYTAMVSNRSEGVADGGNKMQINTGIHPFMLMIYSGKTDPDFFAEHFVDNLKNLFQTVLELEENDFELIEKLIESQPDDLKNNFSDPSLVLSGIILSGYKPPFLMDKNDLEDLKYFIKINGISFAEKLIVLFSIAAKNKLFNN